MLACARFSRWVVAGAFACGVGVACAAFSVSSVRGALMGRELHIDATLELGLTPAVEEAVNKGIPLEVSFDIILKRHRRLWWDRDVESWTFTRRIQFHALSDQYVVAGPGDERESFLSLRDAMRYMGALHGMVLSLREDPVDGDYLMHIRSQVDVESLPAPLRPVAYASPAWRLSTGWTTWTVQP